MAPPRVSFFLVIDPLAMGFGGLAAKLARVFEQVLEQLRLSLTEWVRLRELVPGFVIQGKAKVAAAVSGLQVALVASIRYPTGQS